MPRVPASQSERLAYDLLATARAVLASPHNVTPMPLVGAAMAMLQEQALAAFKRIGAHGE